MARQFTSVRRLVFGSLSDYASSGRPHHCEEPEMKNLIADTRRLRCFKTKPFPWYILESLLFENGYQAVVLYRIAGWFKRNGIPLFGPFFSLLSLFLNGVDISPGATIGPGLLISHGTGLVVGESAEIGENATLMHQVTIGAPDTGRLEQMPKIGRNVFVGAGAAIIGSIEIGDDVIIGTNTIITEHVPSHHRVVNAAPMRSMRRSGHYQPIAIEDRD
jgi:serine O-acetyltransferase